MLLETCFEYITKHIFATINPLTKPIFIKQFHVFREYMKGTILTIKGVPNYFSNNFLGINAYEKNISPSEKFHSIVKSLEPDEDITVS